MTTACASTPPTVVADAWAEMVASLANMVESALTGDGPSGDGTRFEWELRGFGRVVQELAEFERNRRVRIVPHLTSLKGGHRFTFTSVAEGTRIDHELEMVPQGVFRLMGPVTAMIGRRNLRETAAALEKRLSDQR